MNFPRGIRSSLSTIFSLVTIASVVSSCCHLEALTAKPTSKPPVRSEGLQAANVAQQAMLLGVPGLTLGLLLNQLFDRASQLLQQAQNVGLVLEVQAASQAITVIGYAQQAYANSLDLTVDRLSAIQQQVVSDIKGILDDIDNRTLGSVDQIADRFQNIVNAFPFSNHFPQVASYSAAYVAPGDPAQFAFQVKGNFFDIGRDGFDSYLDVGGQLIKNLGKTTNQLQFSIPKTALLGRANRVDYRAATLRIPYRKGILSTSCDVAKFGIVFIALPATPGSIDLVITKKVASHQSVGGSTQVFVWDSSQDDIDLVQCGAIPPGWVLDVNSVAYHFTRQEGSKDRDWFDLGNASSLSAPCWHFKTLHKGWGTSGKINAWYSYTRNRDTTVDDTHTTVIPLTWGMSKVIKYDSSASWEIIYHRFDGRTFDYDTSSSTDPYLKINTAGAAITLTTAP